jgi:hypothetical protein
MPSDFKMCITRRLANEIETIAAEQCGSDMHAAGTTYRSRPIWWWRFKLLTCTHTLERAPRERGAARSAGRFIKNSSDGALVEFMDAVTDMSRNANHNRAGQA